MIVWYVDDLKLSHDNVMVANQQVQLRTEEFGEEMELTIRQGKIHDYLGIRF
jgi:hypothetical protein